VVKFLFATNEIKMSNRVLFRRFISIIFIISFPLYPLISQSVNYQEIFGDDWNKAAAFELENRSWMQPLLEENNVSYPLAIAVIFPELIRYSALRDKMEITLLKTLYINLGEYYANFSIGQFQMKPSFAAMIRDQSPAAMNRRSVISFKGPGDFTDIKNYRKSIITDMEDPKIQLTYLIAFFKICEKKYKTNRKRENDRLIFLSTAYNYGIDKTAEQINNMKDKKFFTTKLIKGETYSYSGISMFWYKQYIANK
jgi:hypothetical protein